MIGAGLGLLGFSPAVLYRFTYTEFLLAYSAYLQAEQDRERQSWERARWATCYLLSPHTGKKKLKPKDLITFPWEKAATKQTDKVAVQLLKAGAKKVSNGKG